MKRTIFFSTVTIILGSFIFTSYSCRNANQIDDVVTYSKPYWDDLVRYAKTGSLTPKIRYLTRTEKAAAKIVFNYRLPIYNYDGDIASWANGESSLASTEGAFQRDFQIAVERTLNMINTKKVYFLQMDNEIKSLMDDSKNLFENSVFYDEKTGILTMKSNERYSAINFQNIISDATVLTGLWSGGTGLIYALKKEI